LKKDDQILIIFGINIAGTNGRSSSYSSNFRPLTTEICAQMYKKRQ